MITSQIEQIEDFFKQSNQFGIHNDTAILAIIGSMVAYFMYKQMKFYKKHYEKVSSVAEKNTRLLEYLIKEHERIDNYHSVCIKDNGSVIAQRQTITEKVDNLEDHLKEIKKQLMFR